VSAWTLKPGAVVGGRFRIDRVLGEGGMGRVFAATHLVTGSSVALKVLLPGFAEDPRVARRFLREARTAAAIRHRNVVVVSDVFDDEHETPVIVMELLEGTSLAEHLRAHGKLDLPDAIEVFLGVARGVDAAHAMGVVHRDLKPDNIFVARDQAGHWVGKVLDFGIAKILDPARFQVQSLGSATEHGAMIGTVPYMSYEQAMGREVDVRTDVWSFAVSFVESVSGRRPLAYGTIGEMFEAFREQRIPRSTTMIPAIAPALGEALDACLKKEHAERAESLTQVIAALEGRPIAVPRRLRSKGWRGTLGLSVAGLAVAGFVAMRGSEGTNARPPSATRTAAVLTQPSPSPPLPTPTPLPEGTDTASTAVSTARESVGTIEVDAGESLPKRAARPPRQRAAAIKPAPSSPEAAPGPAHSRLIRKLPD
jgi:eukaryotic-like serine/threonine-protein kinase